jgi:hypothetical protein
VYASEDRITQDDIEISEPAALLNSYYVLFSNRSSTSLLSRFDYSIEFIGLNGEFLGVSAFTVDLSLNPLRANSSGVLLWPDGAFTSLGIVLPSHFYLRQRLSNPVGIAANDLGVPYGGPQTSGLSSPGAFDFTLGQTVDLGADSLMFRIRGDIAPSPSSASLLAASSLLALRRRR